MRKIVTTIVFVFFMNILPLLFKPELILSFKALFILAGALAMFLTQPAFSIQETVSNKTTDRFSIVIILLASIISVSSSLVEWAYFNHRPANAFFTGLGMVMIVSGILFRVYSITTLGKYFTATARATNQHMLIKTGPYAIVRHPSYLGAIVVMAGVPVFLNNVVTLFTTIILLTIAYAIRINTEEKVLNSFFGEDYKQYSVRVKRLIPYIW